MKPKRLPSLTRHISTAAQRLQFAVEFAQLDLATLRAGDWLNLREDLAAFLGLDQPEHSPRDMGGIMARGLELPLPQQFSEDNFRALQTDMKEILLDVAVEQKSDDLARAIRAHRQTHGRPGVHGKSITASYDIENPDTSWPAPLPALGLGYNHLVVRGTTRDCCLLILYHLLAHERTNQIVLCPECRTVFYRSRNQEYCSRTCVNRVTQRRWRERQDATTTAP